MEAYQGFQGWLQELQAAEMAEVGQAAAIVLFINVILGGLIAIFIRWLYRAFGSTLSNREAFSGLFPLLTITVILVISVVKSSLALSLGLVGALSIVRFRAAIKEPEELVYLFFCIAIGVALGANMRLVTLVGTVGFAIFVLLRRLRGARRGYENLLLTVTGASSSFFGGNGDDLLAQIRALPGRQKIQRLDLEQGKAQLRVIIGSEAAEQVVELARRLEARHDGLAVSYVNLDSLL